MRLANATSLNGISAEICEPFHHVVAVFENKIKNLQQLKNKIEAYKKAKKDGHILSFEQLSLVARLDDVQSSLKNLLDMQKQIDCIALDTKRDQQQLALKTELERTQHDIAKIKEILLIQDVLENMRREDVRNDFLTGRNGAVKLSEEALDNLDDFYVEISLVRGTEDEFPAFQDQLQQSAQHLLALVEGREAEIIGTSYAKLKELISVIHMCGYFDHVSKESITDSDDELNGDAGEMSVEDNDAENEDFVTIPEIGKAEVQCVIDEQSKQEVNFVTKNDVESSSILEEDLDEKPESSLLPLPVRKSIRVKVTSRRLAGFELDGHSPVTSKVTSDVSQAKQFFCSECTASFPSRYRLKMHMDSHPFKQLFSCEFCDKKFSFHSYLNDHMQSHSNKIPISCDVCKAKFSTNEILKKHMLTHVRKKKHVATDDAKQPFCCEICGASFYIKRILEKHMKSHSTDTESPFLCSVCKASFPQKESLTDHLQTAHTIEKSFSCTIREATFSKRSDLVSHTTSHPSEKPVYCTVCKARFRQKNHLTAHMLTHSVKKHLDCTVCNARFSNKYSLKYHMNIHSGEKPFSCSFCGASFIRKDNLKTHMFMHNDKKVLSLPNGKENLNIAKVECKMWSCRYCEETFAHKGELTVHLHNHDDEKPFLCSVCGAKFTGKNYLSTHMRTHTGERPYSCTICKAKFGYSSSLKHHMYVHTGKKPFHCTVCGSKFSRKDNLKSHMYRSHVYT